MRGKPYFPVFQKLSFPKIFLSLEACPGFERNHQHFETYPTQSYSGEAFHFKRVYILMLEIFLLANQNLGHPIREQGINSKPRLRKCGYGATRGSKESQV